MNHAEDSLDYNIPVVNFFRTNLQDYCIEINLHLPFERYAIVAIP
jgi:hypothetical protein